MNNDWRMTQEMKDWRKDWGYTGENVGDAIDINNERIDE